MAKDPNVEFFLRSVEERFGKLQSSLANLFKTLCSEQIDKKQSAAKNTFEAADSLAAIVSTPDQPGWLSQLKSELHVYIQNYKNTDASNRLVQVLVKLSPSITSHKWSFDGNSPSNPIQFEAVFKEVYEESKGPELFQNLLDNLQKIVDSGQVDSIRAIDALNKLISTIRKNMRGTYFQAVGTTHFAYSVFRNFLWKMLARVPGLGEMMEAVKETLVHMDVEMSHIHSEVNKKLQQDAMGDIPTLEYHTHDPNFLEEKEDEQQVLPGPK